MSDNDEGDVIIEEDVDSEELSEEEVDITSILPPRERRNLADTDSILPGTEQRTTRSGRVLGPTPQQVREQAQSTLRRASIATRTVVGMANFPREDREAAYQHVLTNVLEVADTEPTARALTTSGFKTIEQLVSIRDTTIQSVTYSTNSGNTNNLNLAEQEHLIAFRSWMKHHSDLGNPVPTTLEGWRQFTAEQDDLAIRDPDDFVKTLEMKYKFKLKGTGPLTFHLGCDFGRDEDGTLFMTPKKYIQRMTDSYEQMFGEKPRRNVRSPIDKDAHLEMDTSDVLDEDGITKYQSLVGQMQWAVSLGRSCMVILPR